MICNNASCWIFFSITVLSKIAIIKKIKKKWTKTYTFLTET